MESNERYFSRRAREELAAAVRALTPEGKARRRALAETFLTKARECAAAEARPVVSPAGFEPATY
ncbi:MAG: hypothetical protein QOK17_1960 [Sphingomonadales bacterium]|nr:hypothetical protein [Sphingomonadales bacterium]